MFFSDEIHLFAQEYKSNEVSLSEGETLRLDNTQQTVKHPFKKMFGLFFTTSCTGRLLPLN